MLEKGTIIFDTDVTWEGDQSACGDFFINEDTLFVCIERGYMKIAKSDSRKELEEAAVKYLEMLEKVSDKKPEVDTPDVLLLPQTNEVKLRHFDEVKNIYLWDEPIDFDEFLKS